MKSKKEITGNTLRVFMYLVQHGPSELRDVQRGLDLSTPSLASYHLGRLQEAGYVTQDEDGRYVAAKDTAAEVLQGYTKIGSSLVPQMFFFTLLFTILIAFFGYQTYINAGYLTYLLACAVAMVAFLWYEVVRLWRKLVVEPPKTR